MDFFEVKIPRAAPVDRSRTIAEALDDNVPNTLLKKDIRTVSSKPQKKIYAVLSKKYSENKYSIVEKCDKSIELSKIQLP
ncbi:MAG: hypothetical protein K5744_02395 [Eubacterium sp.]|nr:hypothetical protein [Eubacterium sp.]